MPDPTRERDAFAVRCGARERERQLGAGYGFGIFVDNTFAGEINLNSVQRGSFQNAYVGYWIDQAQAGNSYMPESVVVLRPVRLRRPRACTGSRSPSSPATNSRRVMEKLRFREEGVALRYLEINGVWEDHVRYAITTEEWEGAPGRARRGLAVAARTRRDRGALRGERAELVGEVVEAEAALAERSHVPRLEVEGVARGRRASPRPASHTRSPSL